MRAIKPSGHHSQNSLVVKIIYIHWAKNRHDCIWKIKEPRARFFEEQYTRCFDNTSSSFYSSFKWHWHNRTFFKKRMCLFQQLTFNIYFGNLSSLNIICHISQYSKCFVKQFAFIFFHRNSSLWNRLFYFINDTCKFRYCITLWITRFNQTLWYNIYSNILAGFIRFFWSLSFSMFHTINK